MRYSALKAMKFPLVLDTVRGKAESGPVHVQIILSDLCNHACHFCLTEDAMVDTLSGLKSIKDIQEGDYVYSPSGKASVVTKTSKRTVSGVFEIQIGGSVIRASKEHPILTSNGWKEASSISTRDSAFVRVRMRNASEIAQKEMELVYSGSSDGRENNARSCEETMFGTHEEEQSDEESRNIEKSRRFYEGKNSEQIRNWNKKYIGSSKEEDAFGKKSNERSGYSQSSDGENIISPDQQERIAFQGVGRKPKYSTETLRGWNILDRTQQSRFQGDKSKESDRSNSKRMFYRGKENKNTRNIWDGQNKALQIEGMGLPCDIQERPSFGNTDAIASSNTRICIEGIQLERGLELQRVDSINFIEGEFVVYNFSCHPDEAYEANGIVVHNCAYRDPTYTSSQLFHVEGNYNPNRMLPYDKVVEILNDCVEIGVKAVQFTGGGEPTVHPRFQDIVYLASNLGLKWSLVTNGVMNKHDYEGATWMRVSLDAGTEATYQEIRRCPKGHFDRALKTIEKTHCGVGFVVTPENWHEVLIATQLAKEHGASNIRISAQFSADNEKLFNGFASRAAELCKKAEELTDETFTVHNRFSEKISDLVQANPDYSICGYQYFTTYIGADENLYRCCVYAYNPHGLIGSIKGRRFKNVWKELALPDFRQFDAHDCQRCQFNKINKNILEVVTPDDSEAFV